MKYLKAEASFILVLSTGEELLDSLTSFAKETKLKNAWLSGLGSASVAELGYYDLAAKNYEWKSFSGKLEITNLTGNLSQMNGLAYWHIHGSFSDESFKSFGGHVKRLVVGGTAEILVRKLEQELTRSENPATGLNLLD